MQAAKFGSPQELAIYHKGRREVIAPESGWCNSLVAYTSRLRSEYSEKAEPSCLDEEEIRSLKENQLVVEMLFALPSVYRQGLLLPITGQYRGWALHFPGWRGRLEACGVKVNSEAVIREVERRTRLMLEAQA